MVVTRCLPHLTWKKGDDPKKLVPYKLHTYDVLVGKALITDGVRNAQFITADGIL
ncbi:hypothetical protein DXG03_008179 [Asterophora parasitica]|uniref:Uncharacterized protein n=1 Tax=Asterophora parasitica TaxID=117018 RepID=A0A9P7G0D5_9AGAR|nr:hypothetical protein DXG03_008179 [Asterophora parasitica]